MALDLDWDNKEQKQPDVQHILALISAGLKNYILADGRLKSSFLFCFFPLFPQLYHDWFRNEREEKEVHAFELQDSESGDTAPD